VRIGPLAVALRAARTHTGGVSPTRGLDLFAVSAGVISLLMIWVYVALMYGQGDQPRGWVIAVLVLGTGSAAYGAARGMPYRQVALGVAAGLLGVLGLLAILSIGAPILLAAGLALVAFARSVAAGGAAPSTPR